MTSIEFRDVGFRYAERTILRNFSFKFEAPELVLITGSSGCGKSTLLKLIAGLLEPSEGEILCTSDKKSWVPQDIGLFPWLSVVDNIGLPLRIEGTKSRKETMRMSNEICADLGIQHLADHMPDYISGGEAQRTAIGRAVAAESDILLMDEPFSALDDENVKLILDLIRNKFTRIRNGICIISSHRFIPGMGDDIIKTINLDTENE